MNLLGSPAEVILGAAQTVFGRLICYYLACVLGVVLTAIPYAIFHGDPSAPAFILLNPWIVIATALVSLFA